MGPKGTPSKHQPCVAEFLGTPRPAPRLSHSSGCGSPPRLDHGTPHAFSSPRAPAPALPASWAMSPLRCAATSQVLQPRATSPIRCASASQGLQPRAISPLRCQASTSQGFQPQSPWALPPLSPWPLPPQSPWAVTPQTPWPSSPTRISSANRGICAASPLSGASAPSSTLTSASSGNGQRHASTPHYGGSSPMSLSQPSPGSGNQRLTFPVPPATPCKASASFTTPSKIINISTPLRPCPRQKSKDIQDDTTTAIDEQSVPLLRVAFQRQHGCSGEHVLHEAVRQAHVPAVRLLLQGRADANARCTHPERGCEYPLQLAATLPSFLEGSGRAQTVELLLRAGASPGPHRTDVEANTPLHDAARRGDVRVAELLIEHGADPNAVNGFGQMPLQLAIFGVGGEFRPPLAMVESLLLAGANPLVVDGMALRWLPGAQNEEKEAMRMLLKRWSGWWRCRMLAWIRSKGSGHPLCELMPDLLLQIAQYL
eukprot:TRINITY_DN71235_c0_g1_i2.p1 TRINITY_DN71235_c0_g1~~TRINITY_DN71235_c0_g1_i2.p1  ORF type:complete len:485 (-),score=55.58 TRINITY_DN71235_c0_g1_i2:97-1551(-)